MTALTLLAGVAVVVVALVDVTWTTVAAGSGSGPVAGWLTGRLWQGALAWHRRRPSHAFLAVTGVTLVVVVLATWLGLLLGGWALVFSASDGAVRETASNAPAGLVDRVYFVGYTVFTLGNGEFRPGAGLWQLATIAATGTGLVLVTMSISYLVPVASAVAQRRQLASAIASLGATPQNILTLAWDGGGFPGLDDHLRSLGSMIETARQHHLTYPVLHYFHSTDAEDAAAPNVTSLAQAVHLLRYGVSEEVRLTPVVVKRLERSIDAFLDTLGRAHLDPAEPVPLPELEPLRDAGVPTVPDAEYQSSAGLTEGRRALLAGLLIDDGWPTTGWRHSAVERDILANHRTRGR